MWYLIENPAALPDLWDIWKQINADNPGSSFHTSSGKYWRAFKLLLFRKSLSHISYFVFFMVSSSLVCYHISYQEIAPTPTNTTTTLLRRGNPLQGSLRRLSPMPNPFPPELTSQPENFWQLGFRVRPAKSIPIGEIMQCECVGKVFSCGRSSRRRIQFVIRYCLFICVRGTDTIRNRDHFTSNIPPLRGSTKSQLNPVNIPQWPARPRPAKPHIGMIPGSRTSIDWQYSHKKSCTYRALPINLFFWHRGFYTNVGLRAQRLRL